jgi:hypothetical protein
MKIIGVRNGGGHGTSAAKVEEGCGDGADLLRPTTDIFRRGKPGGAKPLPPVAVAVKAGPPYRGQRSFLLLASPCLYC